MKHPDACIPHINSCNIYWNHAQKLITLHCSFKSQGNMTWWNTLNFWLIHDADAWRRQTMCVPLWVPQGYCQAYLLQCMEETYMTCIPTLHCHKKNPVLRTWCRKLLPGHVACFDAITHELISNRPERLATRSWFIDEGILNRAHEILWPSFTVQVSQLVKKRLMDLNKTQIVLSVLWLMLQLKCAFADSHLQEPGICSAW